MQVNSITRCKKYIYIINANANKIYIIPGAIHIIIKNIGVVKFMAKNNVVNIKLDAETKSKLETLAYIRRMTLQELCKNAIDDIITQNSKRIAEAEKLREPQTNKGE